MVGDLPRPAVNVLEPELPVFENTSPEPELSGWISQRRRLLTKGRRRRKPGELSVSFRAATIRTYVQDNQWDIATFGSEGDDYQADSFKGVPSCCALSESEESSSEDEFSSNEKDSDMHSSAYLHPRRRRWPRPAPQCSKGEHEPPWRSVSRVDMDSAHGVGNDLIPERAAVLRLTPLPFRNKPPIRKKAPASKVQQPFIRKDGSEWQYRTGHLEDGLCAFRFFPHLHGEWVRQRMRQLRLPEKEGWYLEPLDLLNEIIHWFKTHRADIATAQAHVRDTGAIDGFQPQIRTWLIPELATHPCARRKVYDWRVAMGAHIRGERDYEVPLLDTTQPGAYWNRDYFAKLFSESKMPDQACEQCVLDTGINVPFLSNWDTILVAAPRGFYAELEFCTQNTLDEIDDDILAGPFPAAPLWPLKMHGRSGVVIFRNGKVKKRDVGDLTGAGRFEEYHTNAGWRMDEDGFFYPILEYVSTADFAKDCAVVQTAWAEDFEIQSCDWSGYYRQLLRSPSLWWLYVALSVSSGCTIDKFAIFGDGSSVPWSNYIMNSLLYGVRFIMMKSWDLTDDCTQWVTRLAARPEWPAQVRAWILDRASCLPLPSAKSWKSLSRAKAFGQIQKFWNFVPIAIGGYFDDGFSGGGESINRAFMAAVLELVSEGGVLASIPKFERFTTQGLQYAMCEQTLTWTLIAESVHTPSHPIILGKEFRIEARVRCDPAERIRLVCNLTQELVRTARNAKTRMVPLAAGERLRGQWNWVTETCKLLRSLLAGLTASMAVSRRVGNSRNRGGRRQLKFEMSRAAHDPDQSSRTWTWSTWKVSSFFPLSYQAENELLQLADAVLRLNATSWYPRRSPVPVERIGYIINDSAGKSSADPRSRRGAAAWLYIAGHENIPYIVEEWGEQALNTLHSTQQEAANASANLTYWANKHPHIEVWIEVLDSRSTVFNFRRVAARRPGLEPVLQQRIDTLAALSARNVRVLSTWAERSLNFIADLLSKYGVGAAVRAIMVRSPNQFLADAPDERTSNVLNHLG